MSYFDPAVRYVANGLDPEGFLRWLLPETFRHWRFVGWLDTRRLPFPGEPDRICDTVTRLERIDGREPDIALVVEFESKPGGRILPRLAEYALRIEAEVPAHTTEPMVRFQVITAVVFLTGPDQPAEWAMAPGNTGGLGLSTRAGCVSMRQLDASGLLGGIAGGGVSRALLPWVPLMKGGDADPVAEEWKRLAGSEPDGRFRSAYGGLARVLAEAAGRKEFWDKQLEGWQVTESTVILEWINQGRQEGELITSRRNLRTVVESRFKAPVPQDLAERIDAETDPAVLGR